jgi:general stress protein 26
MTSEDTTKVAELLKDERFGLFTTIAPDGALVSRPMAMQEVEFDGDLWFFAQRSSRKVAHITANPQVNVSTSGSSSWVSLTGHAVVIDDLEQKRTLWNSVVEAWFPDGPEDPDVVLLRVDAASAEYWDSPGGRLASAVSFAKAKLTGRPYDGGENERVQL